MIVVAGEALVDLVQEGDVWRPVPGGGPFNTAVALRRLGQPAAFLGTLSNDDYGASLFGLLVDAGVDVSLIRRSQAPTPLALVHRHDDADNTYAFYLAATALTDLPIQAIPELTSAVSAIHLGTLALGVDPPAAAYEALLEREAARRAVVIDPNVRPSVFGNPAAYRTRFERLAALAQVVKLSDDDAAWIYPEYETADVLDRILALGPRLVAITLGAAGAVAASDRAYAEIAAVPVTVPVAFEVTAREPALFEAVMRTRMRRLTSVAASTRVLPVAPAMDTQLFAPASQLSHW